MKETCPNTKTYPKQIVSENQAFKKKSDFSSRHFEKKVHVGVKVLMHRTKMNCKNGSVFVSDSITVLKKTSHRTSLMYGFFHPFTPLLSSE